MTKFSLSLVLACGILFNHQASALGLSSNDIKKLCKKVYDLATIDLLQKGQLGPEAFNELDPSSTAIFAVGKMGTIFVKVVKSGKVYKLNADNVFELVDLDSFEEIVYANFHRPLTFTHLSNGNILGLEWVEGTSATFWTIPSDSSSAEEEQSGVNSDEFTVDSSIIYETSLSQENSLSVNSSVESETFAADTTVEYHSENDMEVLPCKLPPLDLLSNAQNSNNQEYFTSSELLRSNSFGAWEDELPLFDTYAKLGSPVKKKLKRMLSTCGSELTLCSQKKHDDNDGDKDYGRFLSFAS